MVSNFVKVAFLLFWSSMVACKNSERRVSQCRRRKKEEERLKKKITPVLELATQHADLIIINQLD